MERQGWYREKNRFILWAAILSACFFVASLFFILYVRGNNEKQGLAFANVSARQVRDSIAQQVDSNFQILRGVALSLGEMDLHDSRTLYALLQEINNSNAFVRMGIIQPNGRGLVVDLDGSVYWQVSLLGHPFFQAAMQGQEIVTQTSRALLSVDTFVNYYAVPVYQQGTVAAVLCAANDEAYIATLLSAPVFDGEGFHQVIDAAGENVGPTTTRQGVAGDFSTGDLSFASSEERARFDAALHQGEEGSFPASYGDTRSIILLNPLQDSGFSLISVLPHNAISLYNNQIFYGTALLGAVACLIFVFLMLYQRATMLRTQRTLEHTAYVDPLTGMRNEAKFLHDVNALLQRGPREPYLLWSLDIRQFKRINDMLGQSQANQVLRELGTLLSWGENAQNFCCHINADRFCGITTRSEAILEVWFQSLRADIADLPMVRDHQLNIEISMGAFPVRDADPGETPSGMLNRANFAKERAKGQPGAHAVVFDHAMSEAIRREIQLEQAAKPALDAGEFVFYLQPKVDIQHTLQTRGAEALCRWIRPGEGMISPGEFIPIFEENGFIVALDTYVFEQVCRWLHDHRAVLPDYLKISVNVSRLTFLQENFVPNYTRIKAQYGIPDGQIELELTESIVMEDYATHLAIIQRISQAGFYFSIDDFGSGYSSLNMLKNLPVEIIKLDSNFFGSSQSEARALSIIRNFIHMAKELGITTVAEGVETLEQAAYLQSIGNDLIQGYVFSRPLPPAQFLTFLQNHTRLPLSTPQNPVEAAT